MLFAGLFIAFVLFDIELLDIAELFAGAIVAVFAGLAFTFTFVPASPQAIPKALKPRTVESTITFFILFYRLLSFSKINIYVLVAFG